MKELWLTHWRQLLVAGIYIGGVLAIGSYWLKPGYYVANYVAARALGVNYRLAEADFARPRDGAGRFGWFFPNRSDLKGKYVSGRAIRAGDAIPLEQLRSSLDMTMDTRFRPVIIPLNKQPFLADILNAGVIVDVFGGGGHRIAEDVVVHGVFCTSPRMGQEKVALACYAVLQASSTDDSWSKNHDTAISLSLKKTVAQ